MGGEDDGIRCSLLYNLSLVHHQHPVTEGLYQRKVVADEQKRQVLLPFQILQQLHNLLLYRYIQGTGRLIADQEFRLDRQSPGNGRPLALAAADLMGVAPGKLGGQAALFQQRSNALRPFRFGIPWFINPSPTP